MLLLVNQQVCFARQCCILWSLFPVPIVPFWSPLVAIAIHSNLTCHYHAIPLPSVFPPLSSVVAKSYVLTYNCYYHSVQQSSESNRYSYLAHLWEWNVKCSIGWRSEVSVAYSSSLRVIYTYVLDMTLICQCQLRQVGRQVGTYRSFRGVVTGFIYVMS